LGALDLSYGPTINRVLLDTVLPVRKYIAGYTDVPLLYTILHRSNNKHGSKWLYCGGLPAHQTFINTPISDIGIFESAIEITFFGSGATGELDLGDGITASITREPINQGYSTQDSTVGGSQLSFSPPSVFDPDQLLARVRSVSVSVQSDPGLRREQNWSFEIYREYRGNSIVSATGQMQHIITTERNVSGSGTISQDFIVPPEGGQGQWESNDPVNFTAVRTTTIEINRNITAGGFTYSGGYMSVETRTTQQWVNLGLFQHGNDHWTYVTVRGTESESITTSTNSTGNYPSPKLSQRALWISLREPGAGPVAVTWKVICQGYTSETVAAGPVEGMQFALNPVTGEMAIGFDVQTWL
jgi:hypothetical protein